MTRVEATTQAIKAIVPGSRVEVEDAGVARISVAVPAASVVEVARALADSLHMTAVGLVVEELESDWELRYLFQSRSEQLIAAVTVRQPHAQTEFPSVTAAVHGFDWHEREAEDTFEITFAGHPRLGDFVLHDERWQEGMAPMRRHFDHETARQAEAPGGWAPRRVLDAPGAFVMTVGPVFSGVSEPVQHVIETTGEDVIRAYPRLFYGHRAIEKAMEGRSFDDGLLFAERFAQTTAFAHGLAYCHAAETALGIEVPRSALLVRGMLAELERIRHHAGLIAEICESTGLAVPATEAAGYEEDLLRLTAGLVGHRYATGVLRVGGLACALTPDAARDATRWLRNLAPRLRSLSEALSHSSSFLDRLEEMGVLSRDDALALALVGPIARASNVSCDLRGALPYQPYVGRPVGLPPQRWTGDGEARVRMLFEEAHVSIRLFAELTVEFSDARPEVLRSTPPHRAGAALGWSEAPRGASYVWLRTDDAGRIARARLMPPSFQNFHGLHRAVQGFAFQDFPIILASLGLSVAENDR